MKRLSWSALCPLSSLPHRGATTATSAPSRLSRVWRSHEISDAVHGGPRRYARPRSRLATTRSRPVVMDAVVAQALPNANVRGRARERPQAHAYARANARYFIRITPGDRIRVELSPYDLTRGASSTATANRRGSDLLPGLGQDLRPRAASPRRRAVAPGPQPGLQLLPAPHHARGASEARTSASGLVVMPEHSGTHIDALSHQPKT